MSVWLRPCDLALARCVGLFVRMSVAVSISMDQSSSFKESCPSNVGIFWSMVVVRLDSLYAAHRVSLYACMVFAYWFLTGLGGWLEHHGEML